MNQLKTVLFLFVLLACSRGMAQNDCIDAVIICGDANLSGIETNGFGVQEISLLNACSSHENNSIWLKIKIKTGGTFGFVLTPESNALVVDFDFWIYGPNVDCSNIGTAIRCSTTNPLNANLPYNTTGMNSAETDVSEGPGENGNAFIHWMDVNDNDTYYIAIDRPVGESNFSIAWTGTATFYEVPVAENVSSLSQCASDSLPDGIGTFDLTPNAASAIGNQDHVAAQFFTSYSDAVTQINAVANTQTFQNTTNPQTIYLRVTNTVTGCFVITNFDLNVEALSDPQTAFTYETPVCVEGINPVPVLAADFTPGGNFSASPAGLAIDAQTGAVNLLNSIPGKFTVTYTIPAVNANCYAAERTEFIIDVEDCMIPKGISPGTDGLNDFFNIEKFDVKELSIFNRYGMKVYHKANYKKEWNGLSDKGKELPDATYYYVIELNNGKTKTGWVYVMREH